MYPARLSRGPESESAEHPRAGLSRAENEAELVVSRVAGPLATFLWHSALPFLPPRRRNQARPVPRHSRSARRTAAHWAVRTAPGVGELGKSGETPARIAQIGR